MQEGDVPTGFNPTKANSDFGTRNFGADLRIPPCLTGVNLSRFRCRYNHNMGVNLSGTGRLSGVTDRGKVALSLRTPCCVSVSSMRRRGHLGSVGCVLTSTHTIGTVNNSEVIIRANSYNGVSHRRTLMLTGSAVLLTRGTLSSRKLSGVRVYPRAVNGIGRLKALCRILRLYGVSREVVPYVSFKRLGTHSLNILGSGSSFRGVLLRVGGRLKRCHFGGFRSRFSGVRCAANNRGHRLAFRSAICNPSFRPLLRLITGCSLDPAFIYRSTKARTRSTGDVGRCCGDLVWKIVL